MHEQVFESLNLLHTTLFFAVMNQGTLRPPIFRAHSLERSPASRGQGGNALPGNLLGVERF